MSLKDNLVRETKSLTSAYLEERRVIINYNILMRYSLIVLVFESFAGEGDDFSDKVLLTEASGLLVSLPRQLESGR
jgi:hypothetical protein